MEIETLKAMNEGMYPSLLMMIEAIALITVIFAIAGIAICLAGIAWLCFEETRQPARRQMKPTPEPPEPDEYDLLAVMTALDDDLSDRRPPVDSLKKTMLARGYGHGRKRSTS